MAHPSSTGRFTSAFIAIGVILGVAVLAGIVQLGALQLVRHKGSLAAVDRLDATNAARTSLIQLLAGTALFGGLVYTARTYGLTRQSQRSDRFGRAVAQLGEASMTVRTGAIYALWLLAKEADSYWPVVEDVLSAYVRERAGTSTRVTVDIQAAVSVLGDRPSRKPGAKGNPLDLHGVNLSFANLAGLDLERALLDGAILEGADLTDTNLIRAELKAARLDGANLAKANLTDADLTRASARRADFYGATLAGADLSSCDLSEALNLSARQLDKTRGKPYSGAAAT